MHTPQTSPPTHKHTCNCSSSRREVSFLKTSSSHCFLCFSSCLCCSAFMRFFSFSSNCNNNHLRDAVFTLLGLNWFLSNFPISHFWNSVLNYGIIVVKHDHILRHIYLHSISNNSHTALSFKLMSSRIKTIEITLLLQTGRKTRNDRYQEHWRSAQMAETRSREFTLTDASTHNSPSLLSCFSFPTTAFQRDSCSFLSPPLHLFWY